MKLEMAERVLTKINIPSVPQIDLRSTPSPQREFERFLPPYMRKHIAECLTN